MASSKKAQAQEQQKEQDNKVKVIQDLDTPQPGTSNYKRTEYPDGTVKEDF